jgi:hypothetical protein
MVSRAGLEPERVIEPSQVIDSKIRQKRQNRYFSRTEVHGGYTGYEFVNSRCPDEAHEASGSRLETSEAVVLGRFDSGNLRHDA